MMVVETALRLDELKRFKQEVESGPTFSDLVPKIEPSDRSHFESAVELYLDAVEDKVCVFVQREHSPLSLRCLTVVWRAGI